MSFRRSITSRRKGIVSSDDCESNAEYIRMRLATPLRVGNQIGTWIGRLDIKSKLRIIWKFAFGPNGRIHEILCTVSRKSKKREIFFDGNIVHSGALGLLKSVAGVAADTTLFEHSWEIAGKTYRVAERVFIRQSIPLCTEIDDPNGVAAAREAGRFELDIDGTPFHLHDDFDGLPLSRKDEIESAFQCALASCDRSVASGRELGRGEVDGVEVTSVQNAGFNATHVRHGDNVLRSTEQQASIPREDNSHEANGEALYRPSSDDVLMPTIDDNIDENSPRKSVSHVRIMRSNGIAARVQCTLGPRVLGGELSLKNDDSGTRIYVEKVSGEARECGVRNGDVLVAINGRLLPPKLIASELMSLLQANPRYMLSHVEATLWRHRLKETDGKHITIRFSTDEMPLVEMARLDQAGGSADGAALKKKEVREQKLHSTFVDETIVSVESLGHYVVVRSPSMSSIGLLRGDIIIGMDYDPTPKFENVRSFAHRAGRWAAGKTLDINVWRLKSSSEAERIGNRASSTPRSILIGSFKEVFEAASSSASKNWGTKAIAVSVTGDGGCKEVVLGEGEGTKKCNEPLSKKQAAMDESLFKDDYESLQNASFKDSKGNDVQNRYSSQHHTKELSRPGRKLQLKPKPISPALTDDRNFAVFRRLLKSGATLDEIVSEMRTAGVPKETTQRIIDSLRALVAERTNVQRSGCSSQSKGRVMQIKPMTPGRMSTTQAENIKTTVLDRKSSEMFTIERSADSENVVDSEQRLENENTNAVLSRYRKMVKLGVPAASVQHRMRLDLVDTSIINTFAKENNLQNDELDGTHPAFIAVKGKRAKLHWDAMKLDDSALAVSVWAADTFKDEDATSVINANGANALEGPDELLGEDDLERLATLFSDAESKNEKQGDARSTDRESVVPVLQGRSSAKIRLFESQRSQNISITIAPLIRACDDVDALACAIARLDTARMSVEQLETLRAAMPTEDEKSAVRKHVAAATASGDVDKLLTFDLNLLGSHRCSPNLPQNSMVSKGGSKRGECGKVFEDHEASARSASRRRHCSREGSREGDRAHRRSEVRISSAEENVSLRFIADSLAPPERFVFSVTCVESSLTALHAASGRKSATEATPRRIVSLSKRLEALIAGLSAKPFTDSLAERADSYSRAARSILMSRDLAKLLKHVLAAGNAVNAGTAKAGASAVRLSSLLQVARTKGADGKTTLLDGVVGLLLNRTVRKQQQTSQKTRKRLEGVLQRPIQVASQKAIAGSCELHRLSQGKFLDAEESFEESLRDALLDFPETDGILASLDAVRGADERMIVQESEKFAENLTVLSGEVTLAMIEFGPQDDYLYPESLDESLDVERQTQQLNYKPAHPTAVTTDDLNIGLHLTKHLFVHGQSRNGKKCSMAEKDRLFKLKTDALLCCETLRIEHVQPLKTAIADLRLYFACGSHESLDSIFTTLRDFLRAFCDSRDLQRRQRRAERRDAARDANLPEDSRSGSMPSPEQPLKMPLVKSFRTRLEPLTETSVMKDNSDDRSAARRDKESMKSLAKPPSHPYVGPRTQHILSQLRPPKKNAIDTMVAQARCRRSAYSLEDDEETQDVDWNE